MKFSAELKGNKELQATIRKMSKDIQMESKRETYASGLNIQKRAKDKLNDMRAWDTGNLANSLLVDRVDNNNTADIYSEAPYGVHVETGTRPHFPPLDALKDWAKRHGFKSAWPIAKKISEEGTDPQPFLIPSWREEVKFYFIRLRKIIEKGGR